MPLFSKKIHHLIRYFLVLAVLALISYGFNWYPAISLSFLGPPVYLSYWLKNFLETVLALPLETVPNLAVLAPIAIVYAGLTAFLLKELWNERGPLRYLSFFSLVGFLGYIHFKAWENLSVYLHQPPV